MTTVSVNSVLENLSELDRNYLNSSDLETLNSLERWEIQYLVFDIATQLMQLNHEEVAINNLVFPSSQVELTIRCRPTARLENLLCGNLSRLSEEGLKTIQQCLVSIY